MSESQTQLIQQRRFGGISRIYGTNALNKFQHAHICIIGLGGVGSWAVEALARSAIGQLTLIDLDNVSTSNINRQIHALDDTVGCPKVEIMQQRINSINPTCLINSVEDFITIDNITDTITPDFDFVIDCIDNFKIKAALVAYCKRQKIKLLLTGGAGGQTNPAHINIADLSRTKNDPLLSRIRKLLRANYGFSRNLKRRFDIPCVYSNEQLLYPTINGETTYLKSQGLSKSGLNCSGGLGSAVVVTASFGLLAASYVLNKLAKR